jgi:hypothetical protein
MLSLIHDMEVANVNGAEARQPRLCRCLSCWYTRVGSAKKITKKRLGQRRTYKDEDKAWFAEAIQEESDTQHLIEYESVYEGAQSEISWQPKHYANAALIAWWEERKMEIAIEKGDTKRDNVPDLSSEDN